MITVILVVHLLLALALVGLVLIQRSEGGALGMGGSGGGMGGFMTGRDTANMLTRATAFVAAGFFATSLVLAVLASQDRESGSLLDTQAPAETAPVEQPAAPAGPSVPVK